MPAWIAIQILVTVSVHSMAVLIRRIPTRLWAKYCGDNFDDDIVEIEDKELVGADYVTLTLQGN